MDSSNSSSPSSEVNPQTNDIPVALRDVPRTPQKSRLSTSWKLLIFGIAGFFVALLAGAMVAWMTTPPLDASTSSPIAASASPTASTTASSEDVITPAMTTEGLSDGLLGHLPYDEAQPDSLVALSIDPSIQLRRPAAEKFEAMLADAEAEGIFLVPQSGFRSIAEQEYLFFDVKAEQGEATTKRAEVSAPPGYSEHHTGYAVDIVDGSRMDILLVEEFETTPAFEWLQKNAAYYSFELSFPKDNPQNISYEPWHWRFVGNRDSLETFYRARQEESDRANEAEPSTDPASAAENQ